MVFAVLASLLAIPSAAAQSGCGFFDGIWATGTAKDRTIFYFDDTGSITQRYNVFFERWVDNELIARMYGYLVSSMGDAAEGLIIEKSYHPYIEDETGSFSDNVLTSVAVERVGGTAEIPDTLVFTGLNRALRGLGTEHIEFFAKVYDPELVFIGPNAFDFLGCRTQPVNVVSKAPWTISGPSKDTAGTYCTATSPGQLVFRRNVGNDGLGIAALDLHLAFKSNGGAARALMQADDYTAWTQAAVVEVEPPDGNGRKVRNILMWSYDGHFVEALTSGRRLRMKVGSDVAFDTDLSTQPGRMLTFVLDGSSKALAALEECIAGTTP